MQIDWEQLFGRTRTLALKFGLAAPEERGRFAFHPDDGDFGVFELWAGGRCLTRNEHPNLSQPSDAVAWSLLEIVGWIVDSWKAITAEIGFPFIVDRVPDGISWNESALPLIDVFEESERAQQRFEWWSGHCLRRVSGVALPNVAFRRVCNQIEVSWNNLGSSIRPDIEWLDRVGTCMIEVSEAAELLRLAALETSKVIEAAPGRLQARAATLRERAERLGDDPLSSAGLLNAGLVNDDVSVEGRVLRMGPVALAASGTASHLTQEDREKIRQCVRSAASSASSQLLRHPTVPSRDRPWDSGYELASVFRADQSWGSDPVPNLADYLRNLGVHVEVISFASTGVHGFSLVGPSHRPSIWINQKSKRFGKLWSQQMLLAHELCHLLHDSTGETLSLLSAPWTEWAVEARANAFAAELLMPREGVRLLVNSGPVDASVVTRIASHFGVGVSAALYHLKNLRYIDSDERESLDRELAGA